MAVKKILFITYDGLTDQLGQSQILPYVKGLCKLGFEFTILSCEKPERLLELGDLIQDLCNEDGIRWAYVPFTNNIPIISKMNDSWQLKNKAIKLHKKLIFDMAHCRSYVSAEIGLYMKQKFGLKFLFDMRGLWADEKIDGGNWNQNNPFYRQVYKIYKKKEKAFFLNSDYTISLTHTAKTEISTWQYIKDKAVKIKVIPCCVDTGLFSSNSLSFQSRRRELSNSMGFKNDQFILGYLGSIGTWYMLNEMLDFFKCLLDKEPDAKFLIVTGDYHTHIIDKAKEKNINLKALIIRKAQRKEVPIYISLMSVSLFFIRPTYSKMSSSPTKLAEIMALGVPIITNKGVGDVEEIILRNKAGIVIENFDKETYHEAVKEITSIKFDKEAIIKAAIKNFDISVAIERYREVYDSILN